MVGLVGALLLSFGLGPAAPPPPAITAAATASSLVESVAAPASSPAAFSADPHLAGPYFGARYYGAKIGRFTTVDPVYTWRENLQDPQRWNRYAYVRNSPLRYSDPDGRAITPDTVIDVIAIGYDLFDIGRSIYRGESTTGTQWGALGADVVGALLPVATGLGAAVRAANKVDNAIDLGKGGGQTFEIVDGVRRAKANQVLGNEAVAAKIYDTEGNLIGQGAIPIYALRSPNKAAIDMSSGPKIDRYMESNVVSKVAILSRQST